MSERKVLNKYYPPDFDPSKIPRMKLPKNRQYTVRLMAPFNMRCSTCGEYIYKGKKFNARKEDVENSDYLGIRIYRFYIKCTRCLAEISFKTDPRNTDYEIEAGATRNFMALKLAEEQAVREEKERKEEESTNPMKLLENRTKASKQEIELLESLEELKDLNRRHRAVDHDTMLAQYSEDSRTREQREKDEDEAEIRSCFKPSASGGRTVLEEEILDVEEEEGEGEEPPAKLARGLSGGAKPAQFNSINGSLTAARPVGLISLKTSKANNAPKSTNALKIGIAIRKKGEAPTPRPSAAAAPSSSASSAPAPVKVPVVAPVKAPAPAAAKPAAPGGLSQLCLYGSSSGDDSD